MKKEPINFDLLTKIDIRVGEVLSAKNVEGSSKLIELEVEFGEDYGKATIFTGMQKWYAPEDFLGRQMLFVANLEPKKMMGKESQGMILAVDGENKPIFIFPNGSVSNGSKVI